MMRTISFITVILLVISITAVQAELQGKGPNHHPKYKYSCNEDLTVTFKGVNGAVMIFPGNTPTPDPNNCTIKQDSNHYGNFKISKSCMLKSGGRVGNYEEERFAYISVYDKTENESTPTPIQSTAAPKISGGHHVFKITCQPIPRDGVERIALAETGIKDMELLSEVFNEVGQVEMLFKEAELYGSPDISEVYIGDMFFMYLKYKGVTSYKILPKTCTAYKGTYRTTDSNQLELWNNSNSCVSSEANKFQIMDAFVRFNSIVVYAKMHGFRFTPALDGTSDDDVTISCSVLVCTDTKNDGCTDQCHLTTLPQNGRKRRSAGTSRLQTVSRTIKMRSMFNSAGTDHLPRWTVVILIGSAVLRSVY